MKKAVRKTIVITLSWLILNAGMFGWIKVYAASGSRIEKSISAMAEMSVRDNEALTIRLLGYELELNGMSAGNESIMLLTSIAAEPAILAAAAAAEILGSI